MSQHWIEATLSPDPEDNAADFKADIVFTYLPGAAPRISAIDGGDPGWPAEVEILAVTPRWNAPPIDETSLMKLADEWLDGPGYLACCNKANDGGWE
jgi:hypothetical protein